MAQKTQNRPEEDYGYDTRPAGDSSDPRGPADSQRTAAGNSADPRGNYNPSTYDKPGEQYAPDKQTAPLGDASDPRGDYDPLRGQKDKKNKQRDKEDAGLRQGLQNAEKDPGLYNPDGSASEASAADLDNEEQENGFYRAGKTAGKGYAKHKARGYFRRHKKKIGIGGFAMIGLTGGFIGIISLLLPLKVEHIVNNLEGRFFSSAHEALQEEVSNMFKEYLITRVIPGYDSCGSTIKAGCHAKIAGEGPVANLYRSWADARIEDKLWKDGKGIKIEKNLLSQTYRVYGPGLGRNGEDIGKDGRGLERVFNTHGEMENYLNGYLKENTDWYPVHHRFQVNRGLVNGKFGNNRFCIISCTLTKPLEPLFAKVDEQKLASKVFLTRNVILPRNESLGVGLLCLMSNCGPTNTEPDANNERGGPGSTYDADTKDALRKYASSLPGGGKMTSAALEETLEKYKAIADVGFQKYLVTKALTPIIGNAAAAGTADAIPIAGWLNLGAQIVTAGNGANGSLKKITYTVNGLVGAVALFNMYQTIADETHTGNDSAAEVGSFAESLGPGNHGEPNDPLLGGTAGAEQTPLYSNLIEGKSVAASTAKVNKNYLCNNGKPPAAGEMICPEEKLGGENAIAAGIHDFLNSCPIPVAAAGIPIFCPKELVQFANLWNSTVGIAFKIGGNILNGGVSAATSTLDLQCGIPLVGDVSPWCVFKEQGEKLIGTIVEGVTKWLIPDPFSTNMGGGRTFVMMAGGADTEGNEDSHTVLGGQKLTPRQAAQIRNNKLTDERYAFSRQSLFARMFDTESQYSLVSKVAMDVPLGGRTTLAQSGVATVLNPLHALGSGFGSLFSRQVSADTEAEPDPFGVPQYGYPPGTIPKDPEAYWEAHCSDDASHAYQKDSNSWNESASGEANTDPDNGMPLNKTTNPCMLIKASIGAAGGLFDMDNLTKADLGDLGGEAAAAAGGVDGGLPSGTAQDLAKQLKPYVDKGDIQCLTSGCPDIVNTAGGRSIKNSSCYVDSLTPALLGMLLKLVQDGHTFILSAVCTDHPSNPESYHHLGKAVDFNTIDGVFMGPDDTAWSGAKLEAGRKLDEDIASFMPKDKTAFGQAQCHGTFSFLSGFEVFDDLCHHQHIQIE